MLHVVCCLGVRRLLHADVMLLPVYTCTQRHYITVLHYISVPTFTDIRIYFLSSKIEILGEFLPPMELN